MIIAVTAIALAGFTFFTKQAEVEAHDDDHEEDVDFENIPLSQKQVNAVDLKMGKPTQREMDALIPATGQLVLGAQSMGYHSKDCERNTC
ncbi:MAG TPA: hypothetical protein DDW28_01060 [Prevotella sp.]|nr:hypothetical protein [Candidatus Segatella violae]